MYAITQLRIAHGSLGTQKKEIGMFTTNRNVSCAVAFTFGMAFSVLGGVPAIAATYAYDAKGRITMVVSDSNVTTYYCYDSAGNRTYIGPQPCS